MFSHACCRPRHSDGFTLVELAIVLVIIGLLVGGVLVGQDLIRAATIRSVVTDIEKYNAAANTFRTKYSGLPGDLMNTRARDYGLNTLITDGNRSGGTGLGDGNGLLEACGNNATGFGCETGLFWTDLSVSGLIQARLLTYTTTLAAVAANSMSTYLPSTKLRETALVSVFASNGRNHFAIGASNNAAIITAGTAGAITYISNTASAAVTPLEGRNIDEKLDDGVAITGIVVAVANGTSPGTTDSAQAAGVNRCVLTGGSYMVSTDAYANNMACTISVRTSF